MDDVIDHYSSPYHKAEKSYFLERLHAIASAKSARITFISGDVHCCGFARFRSDDDEMIRCLGTPATGNFLKSSYDAYDSLMLTQTIGSCIK